LEAVHGLTRAYALLKRISGKRALEGELTMLTNPDRVHVKPDSELARLLDEIGDTPILLEKDGEFFRLVKEEGIWAGYDPERARAALQKSAGALRDVDREELLNDIHLARQQDSHGRPA
jgi:hypothetical protein